MKLITGFQIDTNDLSALEQARSFKITGDEGAAFNMQVKTSDGRYYNWATKLFVANSVLVDNTRLKLSKKIQGGRYSNSINFPADADGETYTIILLAQPHYETEIDPNVIGDYFNGTETVARQFNKLLYQTDIRQIANVTVTFQPIAATAAQYTSGSLSQTATSTQSPLVATQQEVDINFPVVNDGDDAVAFGFTQDKTTVEDGDFYIQTTQTVDEPERDGSTSHANYVMDSISNLSVGMQVVGTSSGSITGVPALIKVGVYSGSASEPQKRGKPYIKMDQNEAFADGVTLTFKGYGSDIFQNVNGLEVEFKDLKIVATPVTTLVRGAISSSNTVTVSGTYGIGVDATNGTYIEGFGVKNNLADNKITAIDVSDGAGGLVMTSVQTLTDKTKLTIIGCALTYTITGKALIKKFPTANTTVYLDLDKLLSVGVAA
tara:strand:+ start:7885 stop:9186 length:1302 start_codon:yes stop_codon:yes gene_type:complete